MASTAYNPVVTYRQIGFRVFSLVTVNDSDPAPYENDNGSGNFTTRWKVNGANVSFNNKNKKKTKNNKKSYIVSTASGALFFVAVKRAQLGINSNKRTRLFFNLSTKSVRFLVTA
jgi:hypothetical protein